MWSEKKIDNVFLVSFSFLPASFFFISYSSPSFFGGLDAKKNIGA